MVAGLIDFRRMYRGQYWLEVFVLGNYGAIAADFERLAKYVRLIKPDRVQLNTVTRPPAEISAMGASRERLEQIALKFNPPAEIIADYRGVHSQDEFTLGREDVLSLLQRRPCSVDDVAAGLGMHRNEAVKYLAELEAEDLVERSFTAGKPYFKTSGGKSTQTGFS
jgi:wyosine [tRNA(Phe)-imidazoG37] synthetase (radical SAM superfamily)